MPAPVNGVAKKQRSMSPRWCTYTTFLVGIGIYLGCYHDQVSTHFHYGVELESTNNETRNTTVSIARPLAPGSLKGVVQPPAYLPYGRLPAGYGRLQPPPTPIHVALALCGSRRQEGLRSITSAAHFTMSPIYFHIFTDKGSLRILALEVSKIKKRYPHMGYNISQASFPSKAWEQLFLPCASLRLFLPYLVNSSEWIIYLDSDILTVSSLVELWSEQYNMNSSQAIAAAYKDLAKNSYHNPKWPLPIVPPWGINSGVLLMNLRRLRSIPWMDILQVHYTKYKSVIRFGDQCLLNVILHFHPELVYVIGPEWNFVTDFCVSCQRNRLTPECLALEARGAKLLHGIRRVFVKGFKRIEPQIFKKVHDNLTKGRQGENMNTSLWNVLSNNCSQMVLKNIILSSTVKLSSINTSARALYHISDSHN